MKELTEKQREERQRRAYEARESIQPRDILRMKCDYADESLFRVPMKSGDCLVCSQPYDKLNDKPMEPVKAGEVLEMWCSAIIVKCNGYGRFVDYEFYCDRIRHTVIINGPDAQELEKVVAYCDGAVKS
ncbi:MAG: hypothetical protein IJ523_10415 [Succinivibrionaceae bacterium]|nr:hypothetical protein [Succinivibrionaceae bacterium]